LLASNEGALRSFDSSTFKVSVWPPMALLLEPPRLPLVDDDEELLCDEELFQLWLNNCHGTGIIFPWAL